MKNKEITELSDKELKGRIREEREMYTKLRFGHTVSPIENPNKIKSSRKLIARLLTEEKRRLLVNVQ
jgi:large subunit ribosomal protein L29